MVSKVHNEISILFCDFIEGLFKKEFRQIVEELSLQQIDWFVPRGSLQHKHDLV
jgi:hypothetical protein